MHDRCITLPDPIDARIILRGRGLSATDLATWLLADDGPIAEDERVARAANPSPWRRITDKAHLDPTAIFGADRPGGMEKLRHVASVELSWECDANAAHITAWDPARVLAECGAKRQLIALHGPVTLRGGPGGKYFETTEACTSCSPPQFAEDAYPCPTLLALAQPYAGRPGWHEEWKL